MGARRRLRGWLLFPLGLVLLGVLIQQVGTEHVFNQLARLKWLAPLILLPYGIVFIFDTMGWACMLPPLIPLRRAYLIRLAGEAVNNLTPTAYLGGEPVKAFLVRRFGIPTHEAIASVVVARTTLTASQIVFLLLGLTAFLWRAGLLAEHFLTVAGVGGGAALFLFLLVQWQRRGLLASAAGVLARIAPRTRLVHRLVLRAREADTIIRAFYRERKGTVLRSAAYHFVGWMLGTSEVWLILYLMNTPISWRDALIIEALAQPLKAASVLVPGALGIQEAGGVLIFSLLGMDTATGLALMLLKRVRELSYNLVGLLVLSRWSILPLRPVTGSGVQGRPSPEDLAAS